MAVELPLSPPVDGWAASGFRRILTLLWKIVFMVCHTSESEPSHFENYWVFFKIAFLFSFYMHCKLF